MSEVVVDVLYIKMIEKMIHRSLTDEEMESVRFEEPIFVQNSYGTWMSFRVPLLVFPHDVMPKDTDANSLLALSQNENIFDYAFDVGTILKVGGGV